MAGVVVVLVIYSIAVPVSLYVIYDTYFKAAIATVL
jgi:hypothetical protein